MSGDTVTSGQPLNDGERDFEGALRPQSLSEFVGQQKVVSQLGLLLQAAEMDFRTPDHIL